MHLLYLFPLGAKPPDREEEILQQLALVDEAEPGDESDDGGQVAMSEDEWPAGGSADEAPAGDRSEGSGATAPSTEGEAAGE
jgi:hypothetical protein